VALVHYVLGEPNQVETGMLRRVLAEIVPGQQRIMSTALDVLFDETKPHCRDRCGVAAP